MTEIVEIAHDYIRGMRDTFTSPDDDWMSTLILDRTDGERVVIALPNGADALAVQAILIHAKAVQAVLIRSSWTSERLNVRPSKDPNREEALVLYYVSHDELRVEMADIVRSKWCAPTLGDFDTLERFDGPILDAMRCGIRY